MIDINAGTKDGLVDQMTVVNHRGLIGRVIDPSLNKSRVLLLILLLLFFLLNSLLAIVLFNELTKSYQVCVVSKADSHTVSIHPNTMNLCESFLLSVLSLLPSLQVTTSSLTNTFFSVDKKF